MLLISLILERKLVSVYTAMEPTVFLYENGVSIQQFTAKDSDIKPHPLLLGNISKDIQSIT